ncbi:MAG: thioredoxin [Bacteroidales bacterium]|nr:thioredoxin [Bacteroidales bacterium]
MKKIALVVALFLGLMIISCSSTSGEKSPTGGTEQTVATQPAVAVPDMPEGEDGKVINLTKATFLKKVWNYEKNPDQWIYEGDKPCMIDFYADWCKPCKMVAPIMDELAAEYKGKIYVYKIDTQVERELAQVFNVTSIPRVLFVPKHGEPQMSVGALPKPTFVQAINEVLLAD